MSTQSVDAEAPRPIHTATQGVPAGDKINRSIIRFFFRMEQAVAQRPGLSYEPHPNFRPGILQDDSVLADCRGKRVGILIVAYNAVSTLTKVLKRITPNVWHNVEEVVVFDDASQDATYELAIGIKTLTELPKLTVIKHEKNLGYGGNQKAGYQYFIDRGFDVVVLLHGDGQYAPEILAHMYEPIVNGRAEAVFGSRMMKAYGGPLKGGMPLYKYAGNRILTAVENIALGMRLTEFHSGYRAYDLHALKQLDFSRMANGFHFDTEIIIKLNHQRFRIAEIPIPTYYGDEICYVNGMKYAKDVVRAVWRYRQCTRSATRYPEFEEYFVNYPIKESRHSSHAYAREMAGSGNEVLDVGCGQGFMAEQLVRNNNRITGIDIIPPESTLPCLEAYYRGDLDEGLRYVVTSMAKTFDRVLLLDVLEHLRAPERLLQDVRPALKDSGFLIVSLPNVANITVRFLLLFGRFDYTDRGILDRTHLRFYTRRTARALLAENGYEIAEERATVMPLELVLGLSAKNPLIRLGNQALSLLTAVFPRLFGYQFVYLARRQRHSAQVST